MSLRTLLELLQVVSLGVIVWLAEQARRASVTAVALALAEKTAKAKTMKHRMTTWADLTTEDLKQRLKELPLLADIIRAELTRRAAGIVPVEK